MSSRVHWPVRWLPDSSFDKDNPQSNNGQGKWQVYISNYDTFGPIQTEDVPVDVVIEDVRNPFHDRNTQFSLIFITIFVCKIIGLTLLKASSVIYCLFTTHKWLRWHWHRRTQLRKHSDGHLISFCHIPILHYFLLPFLIVSIVGKLSVNM